MKPRKDRIDTSPRAQGLQTPFASLDVDGLPPGPTPALPTETDREPACPAKLGRVVLRRETAHRGGKTVIVVDAFASHLSDAFIEALSAKIRKTIGCGGTTRNRTIEIQGNQPDQIRLLLEEAGFRVVGVR